MTTFRCTADILISLNGISRIDSFIIWSADRSFDHLYRPLHGPEPLHAELSAVISIVVIFHQACRIQIPYIKVRHLKVYICFIH